MIRAILLIITVCMLSACNKGPKVVDPVYSEEEQASSTGIFNQAPVNKMPEFGDDEVHSVVVREIIPTEKYVYLKVEENDEEFWISTRKKEFQVGKNYFYRGGLLKTNFESKEHNRVFDKIYLVSNVVESSHGLNNTNVAPKQKNPDTETQSMSVKGVPDVPGSMKIAELIENPEKYKGEEVQLTGKCVKINPNIMGRNWIHLKDGSKDDYDLVVTSDVMVPEGSIVTLKGVVALNKDFGAGYKYDIIVEGGGVVKIPTH